MLEFMSSMEKVTGDVDDFVVFQQDRILLALHYVGVDFMNNAKTNASFHNQSGNLRSSIGYAVILDGKVLDEDYELTGDGQDGITASKELVRKLARENESGFVLVGMAGMEYAAAVESKGYDVITGSTPMAEELLNFFKEELKLS